MKYMGSKNRIAKYILPIMLAERKPDQWWVEPFVGGANMIDKVDGLRIGADSNKYLIALLQATQEGYEFSYITKEDYFDLRDNKEQRPRELVGYAGICCSYSGKWFGGYAGKVQTKQGERDYQMEALKNIEKQRSELWGIIFQAKTYSMLHIPPNSIIYCDPPYRGTTSYKDAFDHDVFWEWAREKAREGHTVFVSEYESPDDFECIWQQEVKSSLSANGKSGGNKKSIEKLFILKTKRGWMI